MALKISNRKARALWLDSQGLSGAPTGKLTPDALTETIRGIGFVQLDTIQIVSRAHHHILWSRNQNYREPMLDALMATHRGVFEHFTHDASVIPMDAYPFWQRQFRRMKALHSKGNWSKYLPPPKEREKIRKRIEEEGPLSTRDFSGKADKSNHAWMRPPHKIALDYMWYAGTLATSHRHNFIKHYDLFERVIPQAFRENEKSDSAQMDWLCRSALERLGFGTEADIQSFWDASDLGEVKAWTSKQKHKLIPVEVMTADGFPLNALASENIEARLTNLKAPTSRLRILNPFDPVVRDRARLERLFGFKYRIEIFVPAAKRQYGYYIYPILEGDKFIGRVETRADRKAGVLTVENLWPEPGVQFSGGRAGRLEAELSRLMRLAGVSEIIWRKPARRVVV
jgi:uncharacterized protein YcaQ